MLQEVCFFRVLSAFILSDFRAFNVVDDIFFVRNSSLIFKFAELIFQSIAWLVKQFYVNFL